jgi:AraC-like DNA-binding protein
VATIAIALDAPFILTAPHPGTPERRQIAIIPPGVRHHLTAGGSMAFLYLDALSDDHLQLRSVDLAAASDRILEAGPDAVADWDVDTFWRVFGMAARAPVGPRLAEAIRALDTRPEDFRRVADVAAIAGLSPSRFQAVFAEATGMPFRRYRTWRRMAVVIRALADGRSLTEAALASGFSGSSHLSTTFRTMFGLSPSALRKLGVQMRVVDGGHLL